MSHTSEMAKIQNQHFKSHVPDPEVFDDYLRRDLERYFSKQLRRKEVSLDYQLLRSSPTLTQSSRVEFYLWIEVSYGRRPITSGAARVAAIEGVRFKVLEYSNVSELSAAPASLVANYPYEVRESFKQLIH